MPNEVQRLCGRVVFNALDLSPICVGLVARAVDQQHHVRLRLLARGSTLPSWMLAQVSRALVALVDGMALENIEDLAAAARRVLLERDLDFRSNSSRRTRMECPEPKSKTQLGLWRLCGIEVL